jgi:hypothetical protein
MPGMGAVVSIRARQARHTSSTASSATEGYRPAATWRDTRATAAIWPSVTDSP